MLRRVPIAELGHCIISVCDFIFNSESDNIVFDLYMPEGYYYGMSVLADLPITNTLPDDIGILMTFGGYSVDFINYTLYCPNTANRCLVTIPGSMFAEYGVLDFSSIIVYDTNFRVSSYYNVYNLA